MEYSRYCLFPLFLLFGVIAMWFVCLGLTIGLGHKTGAVFISNTGEYHPEQGIFTMTTNVGAVGIATMQILHYRYAAQYGGPTRLNKATLIVGLLSDLGLSIAGAFQMNKIPEVHILGAALTFLLGTAYGWLQTLLSYKLRHASTSMGTFRLRLFLVVLVTGTLVPFVVTFSLFADTPDMRVVPVTLEWILGILMQTYLATLAWELRKVTAIVISLDIEGLFDLQKKAAASLSSISTV
ncbi:modulator of macroautophagy TMEM150B-like [Branchiostoma floridae x Branchiostoma japonicum]